MTSCSNTRHFTTIQRRLRLHAGKLRPKTVGVFKEIWSEKHVQRTSAGPASNSKINTEWLTRFSLVLISSLKYKAIYRFRGLKKENQGLGETKMSVTGGMNYFHQGKSFLRDCIFQPIKKFSSWVWNLMIHYHSKKCCEYVLYDIRLIHLMLYLPSFFLFTHKSRKSFSYR